MKIAFTVLLSFLLSFSASGEFQLCKHHSGIAHVFSGGEKCDGEHAELHEHDHVAHDDHDHGDTHSDHEATGEHHEPCSHESISTGGDLVPVIVKADFSSSLIVANLPAENYAAAGFALPTSSVLVNRLSRGPPGHDSPLRHFATSIRLTL